MATTVAQLKAIIGVDLDPLKAGLARGKAELEDFAGSAQSAGKKVSDAFSKIDADKIVNVGEKMTVGLTLPLAAAGAASIKMASDVAESQSKVNVVFGQSAAAINAFAATSASAWGLSKASALEATGTLGNLFKTIGLGEKAGADMSVSMVKLAVDLASFNNIGTDEALEKIRAGLVGEAEPLRALGVLLSEDAVKAKAMAMGLADANGELTEGQKVQARYALILEQTTSAQGDFARTQDGLAGSTKTLQAEISDASVVLGQKLLPIAKDVVKTATDLLDRFTSLPEPVQNAALAIAGVTMVAGPLLIAFGNLIKAGQTIHAWWLTLSTAKTALAVATTAETAAEVANTGALGANTVALNANAAAAGRAALAKRLLAAAGGVGGLALGAGALAGAAALAEGAHGAGQTMKTSEQFKAEVMGNKGLNQQQKMALLRDWAFRHTVGDEADWMTKASMSVWGALNPGNNITTPLNEKERKTLAEAQSVISRQQQEKALKEQSAAMASAGIAAPGALTAAAPGLPATSPEMGSFPAQTPASWFTPLAMPRMPGMNRNAISPRHNLYGAAAGGPGSVTALGSGRPAIPSMPDSPFWTDEFGQLRKNAPLPQVPAGPGVQQLVVNFAPGTPLAEVLRQTEQLLMRHSRSLEFGPSN